MTWDKETLTAIHRDIIRGLSYSQIGKKYGTTTGAIAGRVHRDGLGRFGWTYEGQKRTGRSENINNSRDWDQRLFEPWEKYAARKRAERMRA